MEIKSNVTVIIPCYNDGKYIVEAVNSILNQTLKPEKIIIIDDGSNLETKMILKTISHEMISIVFQENQGVCKARNVGIDRATTDYILTLDADDYFEPTFIEKAVLVLNTNESIGVVGCLYKVIKGNITQKESVKPLGGTVKNFLVKNNGMACSLFRKNCWQEVSGYDEKMCKGYEDWEFWIAVLRNKWEMHIIQEDLFNYRMKPISRDTKALKDFDFELRQYIFLKHKPVFLEHYEFYALELLRINCNFRRKNNTLENSLNYEIGEILLFPLRLVKRLLQ
ncbi:glycosyltransferase family 2 protein [Flavobacterium sp. GB2R13]|uniref:glycosyltransferase family 2 protein n=1 Tax=Flavobacterium algoris TaxID=3398733 RepID=UPI003A84CEC6